MLEGVKAMGYVDPTPIQWRAIPLILEGRDVIGSAQTGTGKTAAFGLPVLQKLERHAPGPRFLILNRPANWLPRWKPPSAILRGLRICAWRWCSAVWDTAGRWTR